MPNNRKNQWHWALETGRGEEFSPYLLPPSPDFYLIAKVKCIISRRWQPPALENCLILKQQTPQLRASIRYQCDQMIGMKFQLYLGSLFSQIKVRHWWVSIFLWIALVAPAQASVILRVAIERGVNQVKVGSSTTGIVKDSTGRTLGQLPAMSA